MGACRRGGWEGCSCFYACLADKVQKESNVAPAVLLAPRNAMLPGKPQLGSEHKKEYAS